MAATPSGAATTHIMRIACTPAFLMMSIAATALPPVASIGSASSTTLAASLVLLADPMLATGGSAVAAVDIIKSAGVRAIRMMSVVAAPEGVAAMTAAHPDVHIYSPALDRELNARKFIVPGLGDFGDRLYGTV